MIAGTEPQRVSSPRATNIYMFRLQCLFMFERYLPVISSSFFLKKKRG